MTIGSASSPYAFAGVIAYYRATLTPNVPLSSAYAAAGRNNLQAEIGLVLKEASQGAPLTAADQLEVSRCCALADALSQADKRSQAQLPTPEACS